MKPKYETVPPLIDHMPSGIKYIVGNEAAERFSFYGMKAILFTYMTKLLLARDGSFDVMGVEEATSWIHAFVWAVYLFPIFGAILSDAYLGKYRTIILLSFVYCAGHAVLALMDTPQGSLFGLLDGRYVLLVGLGLIALGAGGIKPCVSAHVGDQFGSRNQQLLPRVFQWFYFSINLGAFASTLLTPLLLQWYGPFVAFGVPGVLMFLATVLFWMGRHQFVHIPPGGMKAVREAFSAEGRSAIFNLLLIYPFVAIFWSLYDQTASAWIDQGSRMDRHLFGFVLHEAQIQAANPLLILLFIPLFSYVVYPAINRFYTLTPLRKIAIGFFLVVAAFIVPAWVEMQLTGGEIVPFKSAATDRGRRFPDQPDALRWGAANIFDESPTAYGWAVPFDAKRLPEVVVRLRDNKPWTIDAVRIDPQVKLTSFLIDQQGGRTPVVASDGLLPYAWYRTQQVFSPAKEVKVSEEDVQQSIVKEAEVLTSDSRDGPWKSAGTFSISPAGETQEFQFAPRKASYVMLRILANGGGETAALRRFVVLGSESGNSPAIDVSSIDTPVSIGWQLLAYVLMTAGEIMISITCLEFSYTQAPRQLKSFIMSIYLLSISAGNFITWMVNLAIQNPDGSSKLDGAAYYWFFTGMMAVATIGFLFVAKFYRGKTYIQGEND